MPYIASAHPSPLSARSGFFGSRPFSRANALLAAAGSSPIDWALGDWRTPRPGVLERRRELSRQRLVEVGDQVVDVLDPDTQPDQVARHLERRAGDRGVGHPAGMLDQRLDPAERLAQDDDLGTAHRRRAAACSPPATRKLTIPPNRRIWRLARSWPGWLVRPG